MKFIASTSSLLKELQLINGVISSRAVIPILEYFLFEVQESKLTVTGTDLEVSMRTSIQVEAKEEGSVAIPAKLIIDILKTLPEQPVTFTIDTDNNAIELTSDNGKYKISGEGAEDFPKFPEVESKSSVSLDSRILNKAINTTYFAIGNDELRPALMGQFVKMSPEDFKFVSTDGNKLVKYTRNDVQAEEEDSFILPRKALNLLKNSLPETDTSVHVDYNKTNALFQFGEFQLICRLIDERFPDYNAAIPEDAPYTLRINRTELVNSLKRIAIFSNKTTYQVRFKISGSELQLTAQDLDFANEGFERLSCEFDGGDIEIGFNASFLIHMLSILETDDVTISLSQHNRPGILRPAEMEDGEDVLMLLMPIVLNYEEESGETAGGEEASESASAGEESESSESEEEEF